MKRRESTYEELMAWVARMDEAMGTNLDRRRGDDGA